MYLVDGTKYDIPYRQDSGLDKGWIRQVSLYIYFYVLYLPTFWLWFVLWFVFTLFLNVAKL